MRPTDRAAADRRRPMETVMADIAYLGLVVGFFVLTWAFARLCDRV